MLEGTENDSEGTIILCFDYGLRRIGVAVGNTLTRSARPLTIINWKTNKEKWKAILSIVKDWEPAYLLVGLPCHADGSENEMTPICKNFAKQLSFHAKQKVYLEDERFSSVEAESRCENVGKFIDDEAAVIILEQWFQNQRD